MHNNSRGDFTHGTGGSFANVNNQAFSIGGSPGWMDDDMVGFISGNASHILAGGNWQAMKYHRPTKQVTPLSNPPSGANHLFAGGGHAAWWFGPAPHTPPEVAQTAGLNSTTGLRSLVAGLLGMGPDAAIGYKPDYQSNGPTRVRELDGRDWLLTPGHAYDLCMLGNGRAVWMEGFTLCSAGFDTPPVYTAEGGIWKPCAAFAGGKWWISYFSGKHGIVLHPFDSFDGFHVLRKGDGWHTISALGPDTIRATVSVGIAEQAGQIWGLDYHVLTGEVTEITSGTRVADAEERVDIRTINAFDLTPLNRPMWLGFFEFGPGPASPGNCTLAVRNLSGPQARPVIITAETEGKVFGKIPGFWLGGDTVEKIEVLATFIVLSGHPPVAYWDDRRWPRLPNLPKGSWLALQAYCGVSEHPDDFEQDMRHVLATIPSTQKVALVAQCYTSNTLLTTNLRALVPVYNRLALDFKNIVAVLPFTGAGRATGLPDHPEVRGLWEEFAAGIPSTPPIEVIMQPPRFTISEPKFPITGTFAPGHPFEMRCVATLAADAGEPEWIEWQYSDKGTGGPWVVATRNPGFDKDHTFRFTKAGTFWFRAVAGNSAGTHMTGLERKVTITAAETEPVPVPDTKTVFFLTNDGQHRLSARVDQAGVPLTATGERDDVFERMEVVPAGDGVGIRSLQNTKFLRAVAGGGGKLFFDRTEVGPDETFKILPGENGRGVSIRTRTGHGLTAENGGGGAVNARRAPADEALSWETFIPSRSILKGGGGPRVRREGIVRASGRKFVDNTGAFFPLGASMFWALWGWKHDRPRTEQNLKFLSDRGFDYIRMFGEVGGGSWADREVNPNDGDYEPLLAELLDALMITYGMRAEVTMFAGGTGVNPDMATDKLLRVLAGREDTIQNLEVANEWCLNFPDRDQIIHQLRKLRAGFGGVVAGSSQCDFEDIKWFLDSGANMYILHTDRATGDGDWRKVRQPWDAKEFNTVGSNNEPPGPQSSVSMLFDPLRLTMLRAVGIMCGMAGFVLHTGAGVRGGGAADLGSGKEYLPRKSNFWEYGDQIDAITGPLRAVDALIPEDAPNWRKTRHHWDDHPLRTDEIWPDGLDHGVVRNHCSYGGNRFVTMPIGVKRFTDMRAKDACHIIVSDPLTLATIEERSLNAGEIYRLTGADDANASAAFIINGERT